MTELDTKTYNKQMQPILTADSFRRNSGHFQFQFVHAGHSDAVKTADLIVIVYHHIVHKEILEK